MALMFYGLPSGTSGKETPANAGDLRDVGSIPGLGRSPGEGKWQPTPVFLPGKSLGQRRLVATVHGVTKESDTTEHTDIQSC